MTQHEQSQKICIPNEVINGFCYPFLKALLLKLKELEEEDRIFENGMTQALIDEPRDSKLTEISELVFEKIVQ